MAARRYLPSDSKLQEMVGRGMTHQEIADEVSRQEGRKVSRVAVSAALSRAGLTNRVRYDDVIPWRVKMEHTQKYDLWMLRLYARHERGLALKREERSRLRVWMDRLAEADAVIHYEPESPDGFYAVPRRHGTDYGVIREVENQPRRAARAQQAAMLAVPALLAMIS